MTATPLLTDLRARVRRIECPSMARHGVLPFGLGAIDEALPCGGLALGALHEFLGAGGDEEDGAATAGFVAGILARLGPGPVLWCLRAPDLYGPGLAMHGLDAARLVVVTARRDDDILWALEEGLRGVPAAGLAAVVGEVGRLAMVAGRRLQLAAERAGLPVLLLRRWRNMAEAAAERAGPTAAVTRWRIAALPSRGGPAEPGVGRACWRVELLRVRGGVPASWEVEAADATGHVCLAAGLADRPAAPRRQRAEPLRRAG